MPRRSRQGLTLARVIRVGWTAIGLALVGAGLVFVVGDLTLRRWPGLPVRALANALVPGLVPRPQWALDRGSEWLEPVLRAVNSFPLSLFVLLLGALIAWKAWPPPDQPPPPLGPAAIRETRRAVRRGPVVVLVSRQLPSLADFLEARFAGDPRVRVLVDRRWGERRRRIEPIRVDGRARDRRAEMTDLPEQGFLVLPDVPR